MGTTAEGEVVYHYCSVDAFYNILQSGYLRLTNIRYMNDCKEMSWLYELAKSVIWEERPPIDSNDAIKLRQMLLDDCDFGCLDDTYFPNYFCGCFSKIRDSLSQWRAYASDGRGVAIGFDRAYLESFCRGHVTRVEDVAYKSDADIADVRADVLSAYLRLKEPLMDEQIATIARETSDGWNTRAPFTKNGAFKEESEIRIVHMPNFKASRLGPIEFYPRRETLIPYVALDLDATKNPIKSIGLGPCNRTEHNRRSISEFARSKGISAEIYESSASYGERRRTKKLHPNHYWWRQTAR